MPKVKRGKSGKRGGNDPALNEKDPSKRLKIFLDRRLNDLKVSNAHKDVRVDGIKFTLSNFDIDSILAHGQVIQEKRGSPNEGVLREGDLQVHLPQDA